MLTRYRAHHPGSSLPRMFFYDAFRECSLLIMRVIFRLRRRGVMNIPRSGPVLLIANHQSFLDPPIVTVFVRHRHADFLAREGLFRFRPFGYVIGLLNSSPIKQGAGDTAAMKATIAKLKDGKMMLVFPEGARTTDGKMHEFKRGIGVLLKRTDCQVVPVGIAGAYRAWPRTRKFPRLFNKSMAVVYGTPINSKVLMENGVDQAISTLASEVGMLVRQAEALRKGI
ncbi:MAG: 1-acyl-sn-glycerol-3-phosphate acyltransferase [Phycisphaerales bacterium]|nr:1-acyl-sn-glycerol-3-phosphate acyltransferase [Phycisphaerales bacterium]